MPTLASRTSFRRFWCSPRGWALTSLAVIVAAYLLLKVTGHELGSLPYLLLLSRPLLLFFGHSLGASEVQRGT